MNTKVLRDNALALALALASFAVVAALYGDMPQRVPIHWNIRGQVDGWMDKPWGALLLPLTNVGLVVLLMVLRVVSPREASIEKFSRSYTIITTALSGFLLFLTTVASLAAIEVGVDMVRAITAGVGVLFMILGNFMGKFTRNYFAGIRTPWTLANEEVWFRTHRLGGKLFVAAGAASLLAALLGVGFPVLLVAITIASLVPVVYSYVIYKRLQRA